MNADGSYIESMAQIPAETRRAIKSFKAKNLFEYDANGMKVCVGKLVEVQFWDKMKSIQLLGQEKSLFKETKVVEHGITNNMKELLLESKKRGDQAVIESREVIDVTQGESDATRSRIQEDEEEKEED
jgi:hypothetical protein